METPWKAAGDIAEFLNQKFQEYDEKEFNASDLEKSKPYRVHAGFLPRVGKPEDMKQHCPAVVIRPLMVEDGEKNTLAKMVIYAVTYDNDRRTGCESLYNLLEFMRYHLLANNPINKRYQIKITEDDVMETFIPDEQPFPFWEGRIDFSIYLEQPRNNAPLSKMNSWRASS
jgi:hypothetical protein